MVETEGPDRVPASVGTPSVPTFPILPRKARLALALLPPACFVHQADTATTRGEARFARAVAAAESASHPRYATYVVHVSFANGSHHVADDWDVTEDLTHATVYPDVFSHRDRTAPTIPRGINFQVGGVIINAAQPDDPIGPLAFAVDQDFGLRPPRAYALAFDADTFASRSCFGRRTRDATNTNVKA